MTALLIAAPAITARYAQGGVIVVMASALLALVATVAHLMNYQMIVHYQHGSGWLRDRRSFQ